jgi:lipid II:glycine glycyltransferase (peptidoglycan interpeptide bridge formation enzyme)
MSSWDQAIAHLPGAEAHLLQTQVWAQNKAQTGWEARYTAWYPDGTGYRFRDFEPKLEAPAAAAVVLRRRLPVAGFAARMGVLYVPKGPLLDWTNVPLRRQVLDDMRCLAKRMGGIFIKIDPDVRLSEGFPNTPAYQPDPEWSAIQADLRERGWSPSAEQVQFRNTVLLDLRPSEDALLEKMKQKTRYNVRLAERKGVTVRVGTLADLPLLYSMYAETSVRDGFVIRDSAYYLNTWQSFIQSGMAEPLIAEVEGEPVAAVIIFRFAGKAWYLYGMSRAAHREKMPNYLLQWEAMRRLKAAGSLAYDLWGAPDEYNESDPLWGVYRFKEGLGGTVVCTMGAWDLPTNPLLYRLYTQTLPHLLERMRQRRKQKTRLEVKP